MIDIEQVGKLLANNPKVSIFYSRKRKVFVDANVDVSIFDESDEIIPLYDTDEHFDIAKRVFRKKHIDIFPKVPSAYSNKRWLETIHNANLDQEWFNEIILSISSEITEFSRHFGIKEAEATPEMYKTIKEQVMILRKAHYEERYSDGVLFHIYNEYEPVSFDFIGKTSEIKGISFYPGESFSRTFIAIQNQDMLNIDPGTNNALANLLSFYFEKDNNCGYGFGKNPYGDDNSVTSCLLMGGGFMNCYLPKSIAIRAISYLKIVNNVLPSFETSEHKEITDDFYYDVFTAKRPFTVMKKDITRSMEHIFDDFDKVTYKDVSLKFDKAGALEATLRVIPRPIPESPFNKRCMNFPFVAILCDHKTGKIVFNQMGMAKNLRPLDDLCSKLSKSLKDRSLPKKIYVNSYLDYVFFSDFFAPHIKNKKVKIILEIKSLYTDQAYEGLLAFFDKEDEKREKYYQS